MNTVRIEGAENLIKKLTTLQQMTAVKRSIATAANMLRDRVNKAPTHNPRPNHRLRGNSAQAQRMRAGFFAKLNAGEIDVPYRRGQSPGSENLSKGGWNVRTENMGFRAIIGTAVSYAQLVQDSANQTSYHRQTGWITTKQVKQLYGQQAVNMIRQAFQQEVNK